MKFFKKETAIRPVAETSKAIAEIQEPETDTPTEPTSPQQGTEPAQTAQNTVEAISAALKSGVNQQEIALKRLTALSQSMETMDSALRQAKRSKVDSARQSLALRTAQVELQKMEASAQNQNSKLAAIKRERDALRTQIEAANIKLAHQDEIETAARDTQVHQTREIETLTRELAGRTARLDDLAVTQARLQDELAQAEAELSARTHRSRELDSAVEELTASLAEKTQDADAATSALRDLRQEYNETKEELVIEQTRLEAVEYNHISQSQISDDTLRRRDDEILALKTQIDQLSTQLRIKEKSGEHFDDEAVSLRRALEVERERNTAHEQRMRQHSETEGRHVRALVHAKSEYDGLSEKFQEAMAELDVLRQTCRVQQIKLERYAELNQAPAPRKRNYGLLPAESKPREDAPTVLNVVKIK